MGWKYVYRRFQDAAGEILRAKSALRKTKL